MSFASKAWSSDTLIRGVEQLQVASAKAMEDLPDPDPQALMEELKRLEALEVP